MALTTQFKRNWIRSTAIPILRAHQPAMVPTMMLAIRSDIEVERDWNWYWADTYQRALHDRKNCLLPKDDAHA